MMEKIPPIESLLAHDHPMILVDRVVSVLDEGVHAQATITAAHPMVRDGSVPAHVGIEIMAQTCGAHVGLEARDSGRSVMVGFLLGTRRYQAGVAGFPVGTVLDIYVERVFQEDGMGVYACRLESGDAVVAQAQLSLYQPPDMDTAFAKLKAQS